MKVIKSEKEYKDALKRIKELMEIDPDIGTEDADELEVLVVLIEKYEDEKYPMELPDPIAAIEFEMDQRGLSQKDLVSYIGSKSKVSEILSGKTSLSLKMIRSLNQGLGIPADILLQDKQATIPEEVDFTKYPVREMVKRGFFKNFSGDWNKAKERVEDLMRNFFTITAFPQDNAVLFKKNFRGSSKNDLYALSIWQTQAWSLANGVEIASEEFASKMDKKWFETLISLSRFADGPQLAKEFLHDSGIAFVVLRHFPKTYLDGAAMKRKDEKPAVILTLRYDRLDNFWFVLIHELAHIKLHISKNKGKEYYLDDLDISGDNHEDEADQFASDILIPAKYASSLTNLKTANQIRDFAKKLGRHPSIIAGRIRRERQNYRLFSNLVGNREVRQQFGDFM